MRSWHSVLIAALCAMSPAPALAAPPAPPVDDLDTYPLADGNYTVPGRYGWVFFKTPDGWSCGIAANGGPVGCDAVPSDAPPGTNQTAAAAWAAAEYRSSETATFTEDALVLPRGRRVQTLGGACAVDLQGAVHCETEGSHGFILSADHGVLW